jgi:hypothetical protein
MGNTRCSEFIKAVRALSHGGDESIECEYYKGGGVRINGFRRIRTCLIEQALSKYEKRAVYVTHGDQISIDCYDDINPELLIHTTLDTLPSGKKYRKCAEDCNKGSVTESTYVAFEISSSDVRRVSMGPSVIDIVLTPGELKCLQIAKSSLPIVGGLHDVQSKRKMKATAPKRLPSKMNYNRGCRYK